MLAFWLPGRPVQTTTTAPAPAPAPAQHSTAQHSTSTSEQHGIVTRKGDGGQPGRACTKRGQVMPFFSWWGILCESKASTAFKIRGEQKGPSGFLLPPGLTEAAG